jgi:hypothetical protein
MFTAYSFLCYLIGLTVLVGTPLLRRETWGPQSNASLSIPSTQDQRYHSLDELTVFARLRLFTWVPSYWGGEFLSTARFAATNLLI